MEDIYSFYHSLLNLREILEEKIFQIVKEEKEKLLEKVETLDGYCIYLASQIKSRLEEERIRTYQIDLDDIVAVNHTILIAEYRTKEGIKRVLIDPTFEQFTKQEGKRLISLTDWPSEKLNPSLVQNLLEDGILQLDEKNFNEYLNAFTNQPVNFDLESFLLEQNLSTKKR